MNYTKQPLSFISIALVGLLLTACGGESGNTENPVVSLPPVPDYTGPAPLTDDVQAFRLNLWENIKGSDRCGACHNEGGQTPTFARNDDVNLAYDAVNAFVDLTVPADSFLVSKVGGGHNCWRDSDAACAADLTTWISAWANETQTGGGREITLTAPPINEIGQTKRLPDDPALFAAPGGLHDLLQTYCAGCHSSSSQFAQAPYFADDDVDLAYESARSKINLDAPADSRFVVRLRSEFHNCWDDCASNANDMEAVIQDLADAIPVTTVNPDFVTSKALSLFDGVLATGGNRFEQNVIAEYEFKTGTGTTAFDTSGVSPPLDLNFSGDVSWVGGYGIRINDGKAQGSTANSKKLHDLIKATGEYAIEAWAVPGNVTQEEARIVSYSAGPMARNFTLGQTLYNYDAFNRSDVTDANGEPALSTADADEDLQATLQHVVMNYDPVNGRRIYVNGVFTDDVDDLGGGSLADWDDTFAFVLGNEVSSDGLWMGTLRLVAIHNRALTQEQIQQNFDVGVGEKFFLLFSVTDVVNVADSYVVFEVSQFDEYSYLFNEPRFVSLDPTATPDGIAVQGMRIGINGEEAAVGQTFATLDAMVTEASYDPAVGQYLSDRGTIIALDQGTEIDEFFLTFDRLGDETFVRLPAQPLQPADPVDVERDPDVGLRNFDEINVTLSAITGVSTQQQDVLDTFNTVKQQLPTVESIEGYLASHQMAIAQMSIEYCNALVEDNTLRASFFPGFDFDATVPAAFGTPAARDVLLDPMVDKAMGTNIDIQPDRADVKARLDDLIDVLDDCGGSCDADRTEVIAKAVCAGMLGSAVMLVQ